MRGRVVEKIGQLHARQGRAAENRQYAKRGLIASICMVCGHVYRIRSAEGGTGGLSHGWCSSVCAEAGAERAGFSRRRVSP